MSKILVIDDLRSIYLAVRKTLEPKNCQIDYAESGDKGLKKVKTEHYDLILLDIHMPDSNGIEICTEIKKLPEYKSTPVIFLTSDASMLPDAFRSGASDYIIKPFKESELEVRVFTQISLSIGRLELLQEKKQLTEDLVTKHKDLLNIKKDLDHYFYQTSHRLRAPLNSMQGLFNLISLETPDIFNDHYVQMLYRSFSKMKVVNRQLSEIGYLRDYTPIWRMIDLRKFLIEEFLENNEYKNLFELNIDEAFLLKSDRQLLKSALAPVIENAVFYHQLKENNKLKIEVTAIENKNDVVLTVFDHGIGIIESRLEKVKEMFYVGDTISQGNGLGLFIADVSLDKLGAILKLNSEPGSFTSVQMVFPQ